MPDVFRIAFAFVLSLVLVAGCSDETGEGGSGGMAGTGGMAGEGGEGGTGGDGVASCVRGICPCSEAGIRAAIAEGGPAYDIACVEPTTVLTEAEIVFDSDIILQGNGLLTLDGNDEHRVLSVSAGVTVELRGFTVSGGQGDGGGIFNEGMLTLTNSTVSGNSGGILNRGMLTLTNSAVSDNAGLGGAIDNEGTAIVTNSTVSGNRYQPGISNEGTLTLTNGTVSGNDAGGIANVGTLTVMGTTVSGNTAGEGGGIYNAGTLVLTNTTVSGNTATVDGGGIYNEGTLTMMGTTVSGNTSTRDGGGIYNRETLDRDNMLAVTNSTVSGNSARWGGGIYNEGTATLTNTTVSDNTATEGGGGITTGSGTVIALMLRSSLIEGECVGPIASSGYNVESPGNTCGFENHSITAEQLKLEPLAENGGPTEIHALGEGSVAIDVIPEADCVDADGEFLTTDQRAEPRPAGNACDVGAFELQP